MYFNSAIDYQIHCRFGSGVVNNKDGNLTINIYNNGYFVFNSSY